jgi:protein-S-isoprenylcysteine O-methyltransferase Ste14
MNDWPSLCIGFCWLAWVIYWVAMAFATKHTIERGSFFGYRLVAIVPLIVWTLAARLAHVSTQSHLWHTPPALGALSAALVIGGAAFTVWARVTLGRNWSAEVTFKEDHELIESGPYALARHPIYTGLIAMALGTAIDYGRAIGFVLCVSLCCGLWWKARAEERIMSTHFPDAYADYRRHVHAIVPYLL